MAKMEAMACDIMLLDYEDLSGADVMHALQDCGVFQLKLPCEINTLNERVFDLFAHFDKLPDASKARFKVLKQTEQL